LLRISQEANFLAPSLTFRFIALGHAGSRKRRKHLAQSNSVAFQPLGLKIGFGSQLGQKLADGSVDI
jgi:hypothetical protein